MSGKIKFLILILALFSFISLRPVFADIKDSDFDGVSDEAEINVYHTDPFKADTDGDGYPDGVEIMNGTDPLDANNNPTSKLQNMSTQLFSMNDPIAWYVSRISGIAAFILLTISISFGLIMTSKFLLKFRFMMSSTALIIHQTINITALLMLVLHFGAFFFDSFIKIRLSELLIPFSFHRDMLSAQGVNISIPVSLGIVAFYFIVVLIFTSLLRNKIFKVKTWRAIHYLSFLTYVAFIFHGFFAGSDSNVFWMQLIYIISLTLVSTLVLARIFSKKLFYPKPKPQNISQPANSIN